MSEKAPYICEAEDQSQGRPATLIFLHGYGDDAEGLPLGLAQQFQFNHKLPYLRWVLPNAPHNPDAGSTAWYMPKALPNAMKPRVPGVEEDDASSPDDEEGLLKACDTIDRFVRAELDRGIPSDRIIVGGFSQGCAVSLIWGLVGKERNNVAGVVALSGYFPLGDRIGAVRKSRDSGEQPDKSDEKKVWFLAHGNRDALVPARLFVKQKEELAKWINFNQDIEEHLYDGLAHTFIPAELRDMLVWLTKTIPP